MRTICDFDQNYILLILIYRHP